MYWADCCSYHHPFLVGGTEKQSVGTLVVMLTRTCDWHTYKNCRAREKAVR